MCKVRRAKNSSRTSYPTKSYIHTYECKTKKLISYFAHHTYVQSATCQKFKSYFVPN